MFSKKHIRTFLLPRMKRLQHGDSPLVARLKRVDERLLAWSFPRTRGLVAACLLYTSPSPRDRTRYRMPSFA